MLCSCVRAELRLDPPQSGSSLLDEERREREEPKVVWDLIIGAPPWSFPTPLPGGRDIPLAPHLPLHMAGQLVLRNKGAATKGAADLRGIGS